IPYSDQRSLPTTTAFIIQTCSTRDIAWYISKLGLMKLPNTFVAFCAIRRFVCALNAWVKLCVSVITAWAIGRCTRETNRLSVGDQGSSQLLLHRNRATIG